MAKVFSPFDRDPAILALPGKEYVVAEATRAILRRVASFQDQIENLDMESDTDEAVELFAQLIEAALVKGEGAAEIIIGLWQRDELCMPALVRTAVFIGEEMRGSASLGEL